MAKNAQPEAGRASGFGTRSVVAVLAAAIFAADLNVEIGVAVGVAYVLPVALSIRTGSRRWVIGSAIASGALTMAGVWLSPGSDQLVRILVNAALAFFAIGSAAAIGLERLRLTSAQQNHAGELKVEVESRTEALREANERLRTEAQSRAREAERTRALETAVQRTQKRESLGLLAGGIAHDFNNLLVGILNNAELVRYELAGKPSTTERLEQIEIAAKRAADLCRQLLVYAGDARPTRRVVSMGELVDEMAELLEVSMPKKARLTVSAADAGINVEADATQLRQVVMNLITNAGEALPEGGGVVTVTVGRWRGATGGVDIIAKEGELERSDPCVFIRVSDTGRGIKPSAAARMFDPFFTTKFAGRGLGLASVLGIVKAHNGAIEVRSRPGHGTTITIVLPRADAPAMPAKPPSSAHLPTFGGGVLLVEDEPLVRETFYALLRSAGFEVFAARDGMDGLKLFKQRSAEIDCIVLDLVMPRMDGGDFLANLRRSGAKTPVVAVSGYTDAAIRKRIAAHGVAATLTKPVPGAELVETVRKAIKRAGREQRVGATGEHTAVA